MIIKMTTPRYLSREHGNYRFVWKLPFISQYQGYQRSWHFSCPTCNNNYGAEWETCKGIVGYSEDSNGDYLILHECPDCGCKWYSHLTHDSNPEINKMMLESMFFKAEEYGVGNPDLLIDKERV